MTPQTVWIGGGYPAELPVPPAKPRPVVKGALLDLIRRTPGMSRLELQLAVNCQGTSPISHELERLEHYSKIKYVWVTEVSPADRTKQARRIKRWYPLDYDTSKL